MKFNLENVAMVCSALTLWLLLFTMFIDGVQLRKLDERLKRIEQRLEQKL
jgi:hypothetical protein